MDILLLALRSPCFCHLPQERIFIVGPHGGKSDTVKVVNFTEHIQEVFARYPDATSPPIPYTELLFTTNPGYRKHIRVKGGLHLVISKGALPCMLGPGFIQSWLPQQL